MLQMQMLYEGPTKGEQRQLALQFDQERLNLEWSSRFIDMVHKNV